MALNATALAALIKSKRIAALGDAIADDTAGSAALDADCQAIAEAVIEHIQASAMVTFSGATGITACGAGAGTCTGVSGTGTVG